MGIRANGMLHCLQDNVGADGVELEDGYSKALHKVPNGLGFLHPYVKRLVMLCFLLNEHMY